MGWKRKPQPQARSRSTTPTRTRAQIQGVTASIVSGSESEGSPSPWAIRNKRAMFASLGSRWSLSQTSYKPPITPRGEGVTRGVAQGSGVPIKPAGTAFVSAEQAIAAGSAAHPPQSSSVFTSVVEHANREKGLMQQLHIELSACVPIIHHCAGRHRFTLFDFTPARMRAADPVVVAVARSPILPPPARADCAKRKCNRRGTQR